MSHFDDKVDEHYGLGGLMEKIEVGLKQAGKTLHSLTVDDLAPIDEFHTRGRESTREVASLAHITSSDLVLDVGCGLGGTTRHLANQYSCSVVGIDLTAEYVTVGKKLSELVGGCGAGSPVISFAAFHQAVASLRKGAAETSVVEYRT